MLALAHICSPVDSHMFNLDFFILCVHLGRDDISCIMSRSLFDLSSFISFAKKPDIIGAFYALLHHSEFYARQLVCSHGCL